MRSTLYDANEQNVNKMWEIKANRTHHLKNL